MKEKILATALGTALLFAGSLRAANAETWVFRDALHPHGHTRSMATKYADARSCGAVDNGRSFVQEEQSNMQQCMQSHGWTLARVIGRPSPRAAPALVDNGAPVEYPSSDDSSRVQFDQTQQEINQTIINTEQMNNDQMMQQQIQQMNQ